MERIGVSTDFVPEAGNCGIMTPAASFRKERRSHLLLVLLIGLPCREIFSSSSSKGKTGCGDDTEPTGGLVLKVESGRSRAPHSPPFKGGAARSAGVVSKRSRSFLICPRSAPYFV